MASFLVSRAPRCRSCTRHISESLGEAFQLSPGQQIRGKKKVAKQKVKTVKAYLLQDVAGYGPPGSIVPVVAGMMRNEWYPRKLAEYLTLPKLKELGLKKDVTAERDYAFKSTAAREAEKRRIVEGKEKEAQEIQRLLEEDREQESGRVELSQETVLQVLTPSQATTIVERLLPATLNFYRTPITVSQATGAPTAPLGEDTEGPRQQEKTSIYGSVTTVDIATNLKAILAEDSGGARVVMGPHNISFVEKTADRDRVKHLGKFDFDVRLEGSTDSIRRTIEILAQD